MADLPSWVLPVATLLIGLVIATLLNLITQNHKIKTRIAGPILGIAIVVAIILAVQGGQSAQPGTASPQTTPAPTPPSDSIHGPSTTNTIPPAVPDTPGSPAENADPSESPSSIPSKDQIAACLDRHFHGGSNKAYSIYGFQYADLGTTATMHISTSSVPYDLIRYNQDCQLSIAATVPANSAVNVPVWTGSLWTLERASPRPTNLQSLNGSPPPICHNEANRLYRFDDGVNMTYSY